LARWIFVVAVLLAEGVVLGVCFEGPDLGSAWWAVILSRTDDLVRFAVAGVAATLLLGGEQLREHLRLAAGASAAPRRAWPLLIGHAVAFLVFFQLTAFVTGSGLQASRTPGLWVAAWLGMAALAVGLCVGVALPARAALPLARRMSGLVLLGITVGGGAFAAGKLTAMAWHPLGRLTLSAVSAFVGHVAFDPMVDAARMTVGTQRFNVTIAPQCSGYEGIGLMGVFLAAYLWSFRASLRLPRALLLIPLGAIVAWALNIARIAGLIAMGTWVSPAVAVGGFHSYSGWLLFCGGALGMVAMAQRSPFFARQEAILDPAATVNPTAVYLSPFLALVAAGMVAGAVTAGGFDALYFLRVGAVAAVLWWFRREYRTWHWTASWTAVAAGAAVFVMWIAPASARAGSGAAAALHIHLVGLPLGWAAAWICFRVLGSVVTVPIAEELAFRGYLLRRLIAADFETLSFRRLTWVALLGSSLVFGALHERLLAGTLAGVVYALAAARRGRLSDAVMVHATTNALLAAYVLATGTWSLWV
jgi:exosortase E/protease (VPEID-CTERM system)